MHYNTHFNKLQEKIKQFIKLTAAFVSAAVNFDFINYLTVTVK